MKKIAIICSLLPPLVVLLWVFFRIFMVPENHIGIEPRLLMSAAVFSIVSAWLNHGLVRVLSFGISVLLVGVIAWAAHFNLLLQYEEWIRLGMPDKPIWTQIIR